MLGIVPRVFIYDMMSYMNTRVVCFTLAAVIVAGLIAFAVLASRGNHGGDDMPGMNMGLSVRSAQLG